MNQDADSLSMIALPGRTLVAEILLGGARPAVDATTGRYEPKVLPRALALAGSKVYVAGESSGLVYVVDQKTRAVAKTIAVPAGPVAIAASPDASRVYVVSHEAAVVTEIDTGSDAVTRSVPVSQHPWGLSVSADGASLFVSHLLLGPGVTTVDRASLTVKSKAALADEPPGTDKRTPNGVPRGMYSVTPNPAGGELWAPYLLLAIKTPQPTLDFESTVFPTISTFAADGSAESKRLLIQPLGVTEKPGAFQDVVSGPHAIAFTPDGKFALMADAQSEDVMVFDATKHTQAGLVRPLPSALLEGIAVDHAGTHAYVEGRVTHDVTVLAIHPDDTVAPAVVDGAPIERLASGDPMPADMRFGQRLFYTSNTGSFHISKNFWVACASCHLEGGSDAVTWLFDAGPRDTPSNAGGPINTGFLLRQGMRNSIDQYDQTIREEQGGTYDLTSASDLADLQKLAAYVNYAIPYPPNPNLAPGGVLTASQAHGKTFFAQLCSTCHTGAYLTDSGAGNPTLDLAGTVILHDIGTCVKTGAYPDKAGVDVEGHTRNACDFDTPSLRGVFATPPYFHDGSAPTLADVVDRLVFTSGMSDADKADLTAYLMTL